MSRRTTSQNQATEDLEGEDISRTTRSQKQNTQSLLKENTTSKRTRLQNQTTEDLVREDISRTTRSQKQNTQGLVKENTRSERTRSQNQTIEDLEGEDISRTTRSQKQNTQCLVKENAISERTRSQNQTTKGLVREDISRATRSQKQSTSALIEEEIIPSRIISQRQSTQSFVEDDDLNAYANKCVRYLIYRAGLNEPIKKSELQKNVLIKVGKAYDSIIEETSHILDKIYGFKLVTYKDNNNVFYITTQNIDNHDVIDDNDSDEIPSDVNKVLIMLVLTNIFMSSSPVNEASMMAFLTALGIDVDSNETIFGNVKRFINTTMVKQKYIDFQMDTNSKKYIYTWGIRAEKTVSKQKILDFVCKIYGDKQPTSWSSKYKEANKQFKDGSTNNEPNQRINTSQ